MRHYLALLILLVPAACGPVPLAQAEQECFERARLAQQPRGEISMTVNSDGQVETGVSVGISSDFIQGRDPAQVYDACVYQRAGQMPSRPFYSLPGSQ